MQITKIFNENLGTVLIDEPVPKSVIKKLDVIPVSQLKIGNHFTGTISLKTGNRVTSKFKVTDIKAGLFTLRDANRLSFRVNSDKIEIKPGTEQERLAMKEFDRSLTKEHLARLETLNLQLEESSAFAVTKPKDQLFNLIKNGIHNIWMVGPAGCGKTTITKEIANKLKKDYHVVSCGIGTSSAEFVGYKYPSREKTKFADFYQSNSIIVLDEFTALDPSVAQIVNAALANNFMETTTGTVERHPDCIIVATSNTFGHGADRQYVSNNQLDASTIDRFTGGILKVDYDPDYESQFDKEVVEYVQDLRTIIKKSGLRRIASTRSIITGEKLKKGNIGDWRDVLIINWSDSEIEILKEELTKIYNKRKKEAQSKKLPEVLKTEIISDKEVITDTKDFF